MALYTSDSKDRVREAVDFVELVSARTELRRAGQARYEGLCPFHDERTASFGIDPVQKVYYCFGCQASGDVFTFVQETEGVDFKGALELLAERYGVELELEREDPQEAKRRERRNRLLELVDRTAAYYERVLWDTPEGARAREYLQGRGLGEAMLREFRVGYAPSAWDRVLLASRRGGFSEQELLASGLAQRSRENGRPYDRFRSRIMFPLADVRGRVLGFGARALAHDGRDAGGGADGGRGAGARPAPPKYLNTADNELYHKGRHLYGANLARAHAARAGEVIVCEGYTDTIALHEAGIRNAVGLMGTALTEEQVGELARMAQTVLLALDADTAGQEAMLRASVLAARRKLQVRVVPLAPGRDPAEVIQQQGVEAITKAVGESVPFVRFRVERVLAAGDRSTAEGRDQMIDELRPVFDTLPPSAMRMELTRTVASRLELPESLAERLLGSPGGAPRRAPGGGAGSGQSGTPASADSRARPMRDGGELSRREETERAFLALCIAAPEEGERTLAALDVQEHFSSPLLRRAAVHLRDGGLKGRVHTGCAEEQSPDDRELQALLAELVVQAGREQPNTSMLEVQRLQLELARVDRQIATARGRQEGEVNELALRRAEVKREFDRAYGQVLERSGGE